MPLLPTGGAGAAAAPAADDADGAAFAAAELIRRAKCVAERCACSDHAKRAKRCAAKKLGAFDRLCNARRSKSVGGRSSGAVKSCEEKECPRLRRKNERLAKKLFRRCVC